MKRISFDTAKVYVCDNGIQHQTVRYFGMRGDGFMFIPFDPVKNHYCGSPCTLTEKEAQEFIKLSEN